MYNPKAFLKDYRNNTLWLITTFIQFIYIHFYAFELDYSNEKNYLYFDLSEQLACLQFVVIGYMYLKTYGEFDQDLVILYALLFHMASFIGNKIIDAYYDFDNFSIHLDNNQHYYLLNNILMKYVMIIFSFGLLFVYCTRK